MYVKVLTVSALNQYIKKVIDHDFILSNTYIRGEISNLKIHGSGHIYFSVKDDESKIQCIMFRSAAEKLLFIPSEGMSVIIKGKVSVYPKDGVYQIYCDEMKPEGMGELFIAFQKLKARLEEQGYFNIDRKKPLPKLIKKIGVVTSPTGAAIRDIIHVMHRRNRTIDMLIYPVLVQGMNASEQIIQGIKYLNSIEDIDVIIIARGGGSIEELWAFNDEVLAYAISASKKPVITGIGHETDFTIADFVSDHRAPTPSAAAEVAAQSLDEIKQNIHRYNERLDSLVDMKLQNHYHDVKSLKMALEFLNPTNRIVHDYQHIDRLNYILREKAKNKVRVEFDQLSKMSDLLNAHNPLNVLKRGYAYIQDEERQVVDSIKTLKEKKEVIITMSDGSANFMIQDGEAENGKKK